MGRWKNVGFRVILTYFKPTGKYYSEGSYITEKVNLDDIWVEVRDKRNRKEVPGLKGSEYSDTEYFLILVNVPKHPFNHPHILADIKIPWTRL